ncbi:LemA family protein [Atopobacter sp. AH10]|uniref:LemA family protein n=1 Tax=Atopobacter sp. AH10 TaxID=2315861 RepID=UPI000EF1E7AD|nr:LemA family protein [Atopobacter sp. AH10]RLK62897.1 LemA family protein [Atopobacter sp. AH10]
MVATNFFSTKLVILVVILLALVWGISAYNRLIKLRQWVKEAWSQIDVQLIRRNDLIPNLVETVKGYTKHESETLEKVIAQRQQIQELRVGDADPSQIMAAANQLSSSLKSLFAVAESYPDLKANANYLRLQEELANTENKIAYSRQLYNSSVAEYNIKRETVPSNLIASLFNFKEEKQLEAQEAERQVPKVQF